MKQKVSAYHKENSNDFFIEMYAKKFEQIRKEEKEKIQDKLNLPLIIAFALLVVFIITSFISIKYS